MKAMDIQPDTWLGPNYSRFYRGSTKKCDRQIARSHRHLMKAIRALDQATAHAGDEAFEHTIWNWYGQLVSVMNKAQMHLKENAR